MIHTAKYLRLATVGLLLVSVGPSTAQDTVTLLRRGRRSSKVLGTITKVSPTQIEVTTVGGNRTIPVNEIQRLGLEGEPTALRQAPDKSAF